MPDFDSGAADAPSSTNEAIDLGDLWHCFKLARIQILILGLIGMALAAGLFLHANPPLNTTLTFSVDLAPGEPGPSAASPSVATLLRSSDLLNAAINRCALPADAANAASLQQALSINGPAPDPTGVAGRTFDYTLALAWSEKSNFPVAQRVTLLRTMVDVFRDRIIEERAEISNAGGAPPLLEQADFPDYPNLYRRQLKKLRNRIEQQLKKNAPESPQLLRSFDELSESARFFDRDRIAALGSLIETSGISKAPDLALVRIDYQIGRNAEALDRAANRQRSIRELLSIYDTWSESVGRESGRGPRAQSLRDVFGRYDLNESLLIASLSENQARAKIRRNAITRYAQASPQQRIVLAAAAEAAIARLKTDYQALFDQAAAAEHANDAKMMAAAVVIRSVTTRSALPLSLLPAIFLGFILGATGGAALALIGIRPHRPS